MSDRPFADDHGATEHARLLLLNAVLHVLRELDRRPDTGVAASTQRMPVLDHYLREITASVPDNLDWDAACTWWATATRTWEQSGRPEALPLLRVRKTQNLISRQVLAVVALLHEDPSFLEVFEALQGPSANGLLPQTISTLLDGPGEREALRAVEALVDGGLLAPSGDGAVVVEPRFWELVRDDDALAAAIASAAATDSGSDATRHWNLDRVALHEDALRGLVRGKIDTLLVRSVAGGGTARTLSSIARSADPAIRLHWTNREDLAAGRAFSIAQALGAVPATSVSPGPGEVIAIDRPSSETGPLVVAMTMSGGIATREGERRATVVIGRPSRDERARFWADRPLGGRAGDKAQVLDAFLLPDGHLRQLALDGMARVELDGRRRIRIGDLRAAATELSDHLLETLTTRLNGRSLGWRDLVVSPEVHSDLERFVEHCRLREQLAEVTGRPGAQGVRGLFLGPSGTGKTLAASIVAAELGRNIYRVDLAAVFDKWVGETEKNLDRLLSQAEQLDVVLLFDEGDAVFASRTSVQSANDRYANLETNFLLQRIEDYTGIVLVTSNASDRIDSAFARRMDATVTFGKPAASAREAIWRIHLGLDASDQIDNLAELATAHRFTGGQIDNASRFAQLLALRAGGTVGHAEVSAAIDAEYRKAGSMPAAPDPAIRSPQARVASLVRRLGAGGRQ